MNYDDIRSALDDQLKTTMGLPKVQQENTRFTTADRTPWCRTTLMPAEAVALNTGLSGTTQHQGLYQIDLFFPSDTATAQSNALSAAVRSALPRGFQIVHDEHSSTQILMSWQQTAYRIEQPSWYVTPIIVRWVTYSTAP